MINVYVNEDLIDVTFTDEEGLGWSLTAYPTSNKGIYIESRDIGGMSISENVALNLYRSFNIISKWWYEQERVEKND